VFGTVAIVGVGLIGGSLGMALRERSLAETVIGVGRNPATLERAVVLGAVDSYVTDLADAAPHADVIVLATPISLILRDLERLSSLLSGTAIVTDVGSTKGEIAAAGAQFLGGVFVPGHPMAGSEKAGVEAARSDLFVGATWAITPTDATSPEATTAIIALAEGVGARVVTLSPDAHDTAVAVTSHLPHVLAYALAALAGEESTKNTALFDLAAGSFASATRVAHSSPELWRDICLSNRPALLTALKAYRAELDSAIDALEAGDANALETAFQRGHDAVKTR
jgi:prephenate dehydrogenase